MSELFIFSQILKNYFWQYKFSKVMMNEREAYENPFDYHEIKSMNFSKIYNEDMKVRDKLWSYNKI